jgi:hypothetical protein
MINVRFTKKPVTPDTHRISNSYGFTGYDNDKEESFFCFIDSDCLFGMIFYANGDTMGVDFNRYSDVEEYCEDQHMTLTQNFENGEAFTIDILVKE